MCSEKVLLNVKICSCGKSQRMIGEYSLLLSQATKVSLSYKYSSYKYHLCQHHTYPNVPFYTYCQRAISTYNGLLYNSSLANQLFGTQNI